MKTQTPLTKKMIEAIFEAATDPYEVLVKLYRVAIPEWDNVKTIGSFPQVSKETAIYILDCMKQKFPDGDGLLLWLNKGFSSAAPIKDWIIDNSRLTLTF